MKKLILLLSACIALPMGAMMHRQKPVDIQPLLKQLAGYEQLTATQMIDQTDEINDVIAALKDARSARTIKQIDDALNHYRKVEHEKLMARSRNG